MVAGGSVANILCTMFINCIHGGKSLIDFDIALLSEPCLLLGVSIGVVCNIIFLEWLITMLFVAFLAWTTSKTCRIGVVSWRLESKGIYRRYRQIYESKRFFFFFFFAFFCFSHILYFVTKICLIYQLFINISAKYSRYFPIFPSFDFRLLISCREDLTPEISTIYRDISVHGTNAFFGSLWYINGDDLTSNFKVPS